MSATGPEDPEALGRWRRARRRAALENHPDRGGRPQALAHALDEVDRAFGVGQCGARTKRSGTTSTLISALKNRRRRARLLARRTRTRLPRWVPGSRRFIDLSTTQGDH